MTDPCGGSLNLLKDQYQRWWTSVFLTITSECSNIPAFSYLGHQVFIVLSFRSLRDCHAGHYPGARSNVRNNVLSTGCSGDQKGFHFSKPVWCLMKAGLVDRPPQAATNSSSSPVRIGLRWCEKHSA